eukprot:Blabericola_migrator_1__10715@NODE_6127_length_594_cov_3_927894_g4106_i0_p1_GENE_NODE_6127_length_594_cov_3_927894_g4106_i0NODE_6127_length_594_cov_3_927894_g4106_i0_p1_ORF_typecomplete_len189_score18_45SpoIIAAlike/PF11964_8/0_074_NODE_6127_length_594_cov_3_927894_g4106_i077568
MQSDGKTFKPGVTSRVTKSVKEGLDIVSMLTNDRKADLQNLETRIIQLDLTNENQTDTASSSMKNLKDRRDDVKNKITLTQKIYTIAFSRQRIPGWAIVHNQADMRNLCFNAAGEFLPTCRFKAWPWDQQAEATAWIEHEINLSNARITAARALKNTTVNIDD